MRDHYPDADTKSTPISELGNCADGVAGDSSRVPPRKPTKAEKAKLRKDVGDRIRNTRLARGMQQQELAEAAGVKPHTQWRYEAGQTMPGGDKIDRMGDALGVPPRWLRRGGVTPPGLNLDDPPPRTREDDPRILLEQQLQLLDELDIGPDARSAWTLHAQGRGAYQRITRVYMSRFLEVATQERARGATIEETEVIAGDYALNYALEAHAAKHKPTR